MITKKDVPQCFQLLERLNKIGVALSAEKNHTKLLEMILSEAMHLTNADGGTLYLVYKKNRLSFAIFANESLRIKPQSMIDIGLPVTSIPLFIHGKPNLKNVASYCYHQNKTVFIQDAYQDKELVFSGMKKVDKKLGYQSRSFLNVPLRDHEGNTIGILQLINARDTATGAIISFRKEMGLAVESLASQAAITLTKQELIQSQKKIFDSMLQMIAKSIDAKSKYTSNHCMRVPILTIMIANAINQSSKGTPGLTPFTKDQFDELVIAAWLHDCGKLIVPEHVMDKSTKLETVCDRLEVINERFEVIRRDIKIHYLEQSQRVKGNDHAKLEKKYVQDIADLDQAKEFIREANQGGEFLPDNDKQRIRQIASKYSYHDGNKMKPLLTEDEVISLSVSRGTLNDEEREIIQSHVKHTKTMLESLTYPANLQNVPEIAGSHHERMDGKGYPSGKTRSDLTLQARVLMIADIFEALTCADRPYKKAKKLKEVLAIMEDMKNNGHIDPDIYDLFIREKIYLNYARQYLDPGQIDTGE